jgi:hypothetical protein
MKRIELPERTKALAKETLLEINMLRALLEEKQRKLQAILDVAREALGAPADWRIDDLEVGFVATDGGKDE